MLFTVMILSSLAVMSVYNANNTFSFSIYSIIRLIDLHNNLHTSNIPKDKSFIQVPISPIQ